MKIGIAASNNNDYAEILLNYLLKNDIVPECVVIVRRPFYKKIRNNFNLEGILAYSKHLYCRKGGKEPRHEPFYLKEFAIHQNIYTPELRLAQKCKEAEIKCFIVPDINSKKAIKRLRSFNLDLLINSSAGLFRSDIINSVRNGILNAHMAYLPTFRGMNVLEWSLFSYKTIGVTLHFINKGIDTGDILLFKQIPLKTGDSIEDLRNKSSVVSLDLTIQGIKGLCNNTLLRRPQLISDGKQYFVMHPRLKSIARKRLIGFTTSNSGI